MRSLEAGGWVWTGGGVFVQYGVQPRLEKAHELGKRKQRDLRAKACIEQQHCLVQVAEQAEQAEGIRGQARQAKGPSQCTAASSTSDTGR
jgi:hypothetical protein